MSQDPNDFLASLFHAAVDAADPAAALKGRLPEPPVGRTIVIGAGKGAAQLAQAFEAQWTAPFEGVVVTRYGYGAPCETIRVLEAAHPVPDAAGIAAAQALKDAVSGLTPDDLVIALICGGGSSLLPAPPDGLTLDDLQALNEALLASGAPIGVMNDIRKCFSTINGGRLAELAHPAEVVTLVVSDVPGDAPGEVASGPTVLGRPAPSQVLKTVRARGIKLPDRCLSYLETLEDEAPAFHQPKVQTQVIASAAMSLKAAASAAEAAGVNAWVLSDSIEGEARDVALVHAALARQVRSSAVPFAAPVVLLSGGETTVTLRHKGRGGRNSEFQLALALALENAPAIHMLAADTDGIDGSEDNAGAFATGQTSSQMRAAGVDPQAHLQGNDAYSAFEKIGGLFMTGPTGTNVNDFRAILINPLTD